MFPRHCHWNGALSRRNWSLCQEQAIEQAIGSCKALLNVTFATVLRFLRPVARSAVITVTWQEEIPRTSTNLCTRQSINSSPSIVITIIPAPMLRQKQTQQIPIRHTHELLPFCLCPTSTHRQQEKAKKDNHHHLASYLSPRLV